MELAIKSTLMDQFIKEGINMDIKTDLEGLIGIMEAIIMGISNTISFTGLDCLCIRMETGMKENGLRVKCMEKGSLSGVVGRSMKDSFKVIGNMDWGLFIGRMAGCMKEVGRMIRSMGKEG